MNETTRAQESFDQTRTRRLAEYDHNHDTSGHLIQIVPAQDSESPKCPKCERTVITRADELQGQAWASGTPNGKPEAWQHKLDCPEYEPHPQSIAGQPNYVPGPGRLGYNEPTA